MQGRAKEEERVNQWAGREQGGSVGRLQLHALEAPMDSLWGEQAGLRSRAQTERGVCAALFAFERELLDIAIERSNPACISAHELLLGILAEPSRFGRQSQLGVQLGLQGQESLDCRSAQGSSLKMAEPGSPVGHYAPQRVRAWRQENENARVQSRIANTFQKLTIRNLPASHAIQVSFFLEATPNDRQHQLAIWSVT